MCEFCTSHGDGKKWYENISNYTEEVFNEVNDLEGIKEYLAGFRKSMETEIPQAHRMKQKFPRIYDLIAYPLLSRKMKKTHFGQIVPVEDLLPLLPKFSTIVRLPCICRRVTAGVERMYCYGVGMDLTDIYKDLPDFRDFDRISAEEARDDLINLDMQGMTHSVWTFNTPFIGAICNCDRDCMAWRIERDTQISKIMWRAEYVGRVDEYSCTGCGECQEMCYFEAIGHDLQNDKYTIDPLKCYGCGVCRRVCQSGSISLGERSAHAAASATW